MTDGGEFAFLCEWMIATTQLVHVYLARPPAGCFYYSPSTFIACIPKKRSHDLPHLYALSPLH